VRVAPLEADLDELVCGALARDREHLLRRIDRGDLCSAVREQQRHPAGAGADVEDVAILDAPDHVGEHARLRPRDQIPYRPAEPALVEGTGHLLVRIHRVAVVRALA